MRVGTPADVACVGSGCTQRLYQAWMPGQKPITAGALHVGGASAELLVGSLSMWLEPSSSRHDSGRVYAGAYDWNLASMRVLEKAGYTREARLRKAVTKDGRSIDLVLYAIVR